MPSFVTGRTSVTAESRKDTYVPVMARRRGGVAWLLFALLAAAPAARALDPGRAVTQYVRRSWGTESGLPQATVMALAQTPDGFVWMGTQAGLARFDGVRFAVYDTRSTPQLRDDSVTALRCDRRGTLWIGTVGGVSVYERGRFRALAALPPRPVYAIYESHDGAVWIGMRGVVYEQRGARFVEHKLPADGDVLSMAEADGALWIAVYGGVVRLDRSGARLFQQKDGLPDDNALSLTARNGELWIGTPRGAAIWRGGRLVRDVPQALQTAEVWSLAVDSAGTLWAGTRHGLLRVRGNDADLYGAKDGLTDDYIDAVMEDRDGNLWIGTQLGGVSLLHDGIFTTFAKSEGLPVDPVWSIDDDPPHGVWIGTNGGGLALIANGRVQPDPLPPGLASKTITSIARTADGTLWVASWDRGLFRLADGRWSQLTKRDGLANDTVTSLEAAGNVLWAGTAHGLTRIENDRLTNLGAADGIPSDYVSATHQDRRGRVWVTTDDGVCVFDGPRCSTRFGNIALPRHSAYAIREDRGGDIWITTHTGLLHVTPSNEVRLLTAQNGLPQTKIIHLEQDRAGDFWLTCNRGVFRVPHDQLDSGRIAEPQLLGQADGMKSAELTFGTNPSSHAASDGSIWFPTLHGAARLDPAASRRTARTPQVLIDGAPSSLTLPPGTQKLEIRYTAPSFVAPERLRFRYRLAGYDPAWVEAGSRRVAEYMHLPPGAYDFEVMVVSGNAALSSARMHVVLQPRFVQTIWFRLLAGVAIALLLAAVYALRVRSIRAKYMAVLTERTRIARELHDTVASSLAGLAFHLDDARQAMANDDPSRVEERLEQAATVARQCLTETRRSLLALRPELLERMDLSEALQALVRQTAAPDGVVLTCEISGLPRRLDDAVEQHVLRIAQEAITNAVRHSGARRIVTTLHYGNEALHLTVTDDGIGPPADSAGFGLTSMRERAEQLGGRVMIAGGEGEGTSVRLLVPLRRWRITA
jgi:signal transduction histidine kinase/ligand-binding sensor domain-containing protein